jgi:hypothetical protein
MGIMFYSRKGGSVTAGILDSPELEKSNCETFTLLKSVERYECLATDSVFFTEGYRRVIAPEACNELSHFVVQLLYGK